MPNDVTYTLQQKKTLQSVLMQLNQCHTMADLWKILFIQIKDYLNLAGICFVVFDKNKWVIESQMSQNEILNDAEYQSFINKNPQLYSDIKAHKQAVYSYEQFNIDADDSFFKCWIPGQKFEKIYVFPARLLDNSSIEPREVCLFMATGRQEEQLKDFLFILTLFVFQLYEKLVLLESLELMDSRLLDSDKFATLGHLTAGIAHEMNSPLGAITAASCNIRDASQKILLKFPDLLDHLTQENRAPFLKLLTLAMSPKEFLSSREERAKRRHLVGVLEAEGLKDVSMIVDLLVDMGVYEDVSHLLKGLGDDVLAILTFIFHFASIERNNRNVQQAVESASRMITAIKSYAKKEDEMHMNSVQDTITNVLVLYHHDLKQEVNLVTNIQSVPRVLCNQDELNQVWTNLIYNALQAMNFSGTLQVDVYQENSHVVVSIADTGVGIAENIQGKIFEPYFTTKPRGVGSGLGLDIVRQIVQKHNGTIDFKSQPGNTVFFVRLPITNQLEE